MLLYMKEHLTSSIMNVPSQEKKKKTMFNVFLDNIGAKKTYMRT